MQSSYSRYNIENIEILSTPFAFFLSRFGQDDGEETCSRSIFLCQPENHRKCIKIINFWFCSSISQTYDWRIILIFFSVAYKKRRNRAKEVYLEWLLKDAAEWKSSRRLESDTKVYYTCFFFILRFETGKYTKTYVLDFHFPSLPFFVPKHFFHSFFLCVLCSIHPPNASEQEKN